MELRSPYTCEYAYTMTKEISPQWSHYGNTSSNGRGRELGEGEELEFVSYKFDDTSLSPLSHYRYIYSESTKSNFAHIKVKGQINEALFN